jgi:hypothetical protein
LDLATLEARASHLYSYVVPSIPLKARRHRITFGPLSFIYHPLRFIFILARPPTTVSFSDDRFGHSNPRVSSRVSVPRLLYIPRAALQRPGSPTLAAHVTPHIFIIYLLFTLPDSNTSPFAVEMTKFRIFPRVHPLSASHRLL